MSKQVITKAQFAELAKIMDPVDVIRKYNISDNLASVEEVEPILENRSTKIEEKLAEPKVIDNQKTQPEILKVLPKIDTEPKVKVSYCGKCGEELLNGDCIKCLRKNQKSPRNINWREISQNLYNKLPKIPSISFPKFNFTKKQVFGTLVIVSIMALGFLGFKNFPASNIANIPLQTVNSVSSSSTEIVISSSSNVITSVSESPKNQESENPNKQLEDIKKEIESKNNEITELRRNLENQQKLNKNLANQSGANAALTTQIESLNKEIDNKNNELNNKNKEIDIRNQSISNLKTESEIKNKEIANRNNDYATLTANNNDITTRLTNKTNEYSNLQQTYNNLANRPPVQCTIEYTTNAAGVRTKTSSNC